jgi:hypothetical protein
VQLADQHPSRCLHGTRSRVGYAAERLLPRLGPAEPPRSRRADARTVLIRQGSERLISIPVEISCPCGGHTRGPVKHCGVLNYYTIVT